MPIPKKGDIMKVLVVGNQGYIGQVMTEMMVREGFDVDGIDGGYFKDAQLIKKPKENLQVKQIYKDVRNLVLDDVRGYDAVIQLANLSNDPIGELNPGWTQQVNHDATVRLGKLAKEAGVQKYIFSSSCSLYGAAGNSECDETSEFHPVSAYAKCKVSAEMALSKLADENFAPVFMRNATAYGVSPRMRFDIVVNNLTAWAVTTGKIKILSDGMPWRPQVHIRDISNAFIATLKAPIDDVRNENYRVKELAKFVEDVVPGAELEILGKICNDSRSYKVDFTKIYKVLKHYKPQWTVRKGVEELYYTYKAIGLDMNKFEHEDFVTIKKYKNMMTRNEADNNLFIRPGFFQN